MFFWRAKSHKPETKETVESLPQTPIIQNIVSFLDVSANSPAPCLPGLMIIAFSEVDREAIIRSLASLRSRWRISITMTGRETLDILASDSCSAIVMGSTLPDMQREEFEVRVAQSHPFVPRFLRSEPGSVPSVVTGQAAAYQISESPNSVEWESTIRRMSLVHTWLSKGSTRQLLAHLHRLPTIPKVYQQVVSALQSPDTSFESVADLIAQDPIMTAKLLQVANSTCFAQPTPVTKAVEAVMFLGTERVKGLILVAHIFSEFEAARASGLRLDELWRHSLEVGAFAQAIVRWEMQTERHAELAFTAGMLHDAGKLLLAANLPTEYHCAIDESEKNQLPLHEAEQSVFSASHSEVGGVMLGLWGLPVEIVHAVGWHHSPQSATDVEFSILTGVHAANVLANSTKIMAGRGPQKSEFNIDYLRKIGLEFRRNEWRELCGLKRDPADESPDQLHSQRLAAGGN